MARLEPIELADADGKAKALLEELADRGGEPGVMVQTMANAPALLRGFGQQVIAAPAEVVGLVSLQLLTGAFNLVAGITPRTPAIRMNTPYLAWAVAVGAAGCGRSAAAA